MIPILILAAGGSTRMRGRDKLMEDVGGAPLLQKQAQRALATGHPVYVALPDLAHPRTEALQGLDVTALAVPDAAEGMSGTLRGGVARLPDCDAFMVLLGDLVAITTDDMQAIMAARVAHPDKLIWRGATQAGRPGHPILFDASLRPAFADLSGDSGGETLVNPLKDQTHLTRLSGDRARLDLDTPQDWENWHLGNVKT